MSALLAAPRNAPTVTLGSFKEPLIVSDFNAASLRRQIQQQHRRVQSLQTAVYAQPDPSANPDLLCQAAQEEAKLRDLEQQLAAAAAAGVKDEQATTSRGRLLGPQTTGLRVEPTLNMQPLPTGI